MPSPSLPGAIDPEFEVFYKADIDRARGYSRARGSSPWDTHFIEMAKNAPFKMLLKRLPKAVTAPPEPPAQLDNYEFTDDVEVVDPYTPGKWRVIEVDEQGRCCCNWRGAERHRAATGKSPSLSRAPTPRPHTEHG